VNVNSLEIAGTDVISTARALQNLTGVDATTKAMFYANDIGEPPPVGLTYEPNFASPNATITTSGTFNRSTYSLDADDIVWMLLVGSGGGGNSSYYQGNSSWKFGGDGGQALVIIGSAGSLNGSTYTIGAAQSANTSWQAGNAGASTFTFSSSGNVLSTLTIAHRTAHVESSTAITSTTGLQGSYFQFSANNSIPNLTSVTVPTGSNFGSRQNTNPTASRNFWGEQIGAVSAGPESDYSITFGAGKGWGSYGGTPANNTGAVSTFSGNGATGAGGSGSAPGGGGSGLNGSGAAGSLRIYHQ